MTIKFSNLESQVNRFFSAILRTQIHVPDNSLNPLFSSQKFCLVAYSRKRYTFRNTEIPIACLKLFHRIRTIYPSCYILVSVLHKPSLVTTSRQVYLWAYMGNQYLFPFFVPSPFSTDISFFSFTISHLQPYCNTCT